MSLSTAENLISRVWTYTGTIPRSSSKAGLGFGRLASADEAYKRIGSLQVRQQELIEEAFRCIEAQLFRPAIVSAWAAFMDFLCEKLVEDNYVSVHLHIANTGSVSSPEELRERLTEHAMLDLGEKLKLLSKGECKSLKGSLARRNECAHPSDYSPNLDVALGYLVELLIRMEKLKAKSLL